MSVLHLNAADLVGEDTQSTREVRYPLATTQCRECGRHTLDPRRGFCHACYERRRKRGEFADLGQLRDTAHGNFAGGGRTPGAQRSRARRLYEASQCERCGSSAKAERHHKDGNPGNNTAENIAILCRRCHQETDGRLDAARARLLAANQRQEPKPCVNCGRLYKPLRNHRCGSCAQFIRKHGRDSLAAERRVPRSPDERSRAQMET